MAFRLVEVRQGPGRRQRPGISMRITKSGEDLRLSGEAAHVVGPHATILYDAESHRLAVRGVAEGAPAAIKARAVPGSKTKLIRVKAIVEHLGLLDLAEVEIEGKVEDGMVVFALPFLGEE